MMNQANPKTNFDSIREEVLAVIERERARFESSNNDSPPDSEYLEALNAHEDGDAQLFVQIHRDSLVYDNAAARWFVWNQHFWREDCLNEAMALLEAVIDVYEAEAMRWGWIRQKAARSGDKEAEKVAGIKESLFYRRVRELHSLHRKRNVLTLATAGPHSLAITGENWDQNPWLLGCPNGTIDLKTGHLRPGSQADFIRTVSPTICCHRRF